MGNGLSIDEWLEYAATESLSYFMYQKPRTAKRMHWDVIPRMVDEYHGALRAFPGQDETQRLSNAVWHIHAGNPPASDMVVPFAMLLNLAAVSGAEDRATLWGYLRRYAPEASPETHPGLDAAAGHAVKVANTAAESWKFTHLKRKTDRDDAKRLAEPEAIGQLATVALPDPPTRPRRMLIAFRQELVGRRVAAQNRIRALFAGQGLPAPRGAKAWTATGLAGIEAQARPLAECGAADLWRGMLALAVEVAADTCTRAGAEPPRWADVDDH